jgi:hypothetical protein
MLRLAAAKSVGSGVAEREVPDGQPVVLGPAQMQTLLRRSFNLGSEVDPRKPKALNRLELAKALVGVRRRTPPPRRVSRSSVESRPRRSRGASLFALHAAAFNGMPNAMMHLMERMIGIISGLGQLEPADDDMLLDAARRAAAGLAGLFQWRITAARASTGREWDEAVAQLKRAGEELQEAADAISGFFELAESSWAAGRRGKVDWN